MKVEIVKAIALFTVLLDLSTCKGIPSPNFGRKIAGPIQNYQLSSSSSKWLGAIFPNVTHAV
jgi:hypothetical protein